MSRILVKGFRFVPRHKKKIISFVVMPGIVYKTYMNSLIKVHDMGKFENEEMFKT